MQSESTPKSSPKKEKGVDLASFGCAPMFYVPIDHPTNECGTISSSNEKQPLTPRACIGPMWPPSEEKMRRSDESDGRSESEIWRENVVENIYPAASNGFFCWSQPMADLQKIWKVTPNTLTPSTTTQDHPETLSQRILRPAPVPITPFRIPGMSSGGANLSELQRMSQRVIEGFESKGGRKGGSKGHSKTGSSASSNSSTLDMSEGGAVSVFVPSPLRLSPELEPFLCQQLLTGVLRDISHNLLRSLEDVVAASILRHIQLIKPQDNNASRVESSPQHMRDVMTNPISLSPSRIVSLKEEIDFKEIDNRIQEIERIELEGTDIEIPFTTLYPSSLFQA